MEGRRHPKEAISFFGLSVGSEYPGTLVREDSQQHLKLLGGSPREIEIEGRDYREDSDANQ